MHALVERYALERDICPGSIAQLSYAVATFEKYLGRAAEVADFCDLTVNRFLIWLAGQGYQTETMRTRRRSLLTIWRSMADDGLAIEPRKVRVFRAPQVMPRAWTPEQVAAILAECDRLRGTFKSCPTIQRRLFGKAFFSVAYETGFRRGDLLRIRRPQIQTSGLIAMVQSKTGRAHLAKVEPATLALIDAMGTRRDTVFGGVMSLRRLSRFCESILKRAGIDEGSIKWFRRSGATHVEMQQTGTAWKYLGHTTPRVSYQSYVDPLQAHSTPTSPPKLPG